MQFLLQFSAETALALFLILLTQALAISTPSDLTNHDGEVSRPLSLTTPQLLSTYKSQNAARNESPTAGISPRADSLAQEWYLDRTLTLHNVGVFPSKASTSPRLWHMCDKVIYPADY